MLYIVCLTSFLNMVLDGHIFYNYYITDGIAVCMCPCMLLVIACTSYYWLYKYPLQYVYICGQCKIMDTFHVIVHLL